MITLPTPTDIRTLDSDDKARPRRVIAYRTHPSRPTHIATLEPFAVICPRHAGKTTKVLVEAEATGPDSRAALLTLADTLFERNIDPRWLCPDCAGQVRWWLGATS